MRYSILTPTIARSTLERTCQSINEQIEKDWEHIVMVDYLESDLNDVQRRVLSTIGHPQRRVYFCGTRHGYCGNTCRHDAWAYAAGDYVYYLDDDDFLYNAVSLGKLNVVTKPWAVFPIKRFESRFFNLPPGLLQSTTCGMIVQREIGRWPDIPHYESDGHFIESLKQKNYEYETVDGDYIAVMPASNRGVYI